VEYKAFTQQTNAKASAVQHQLSAHTASGPKQLTVDESFGHMKPWPSDHKTAKLGTRRIAEMIALDLQPFSIVEDIGFHQVIKAFAFCPSVSNSITKIFFGNPDTKTLC
jgi:hypothetical protein